MQFGQIHPIYYSFLSLFLSPSINNFNGFNYSIFIHVYKVLQSYSIIFTLSFLPFTPLSSPPQTVPFSPWPFLYNIVTYREKAWKHFNFCSVYDFYLHHIFPWSTLFKLFSFSCNDNQSLNNEWLNTHLQSLWPLKQQKRSNAYQNSGTYGHCQKLGSRGKIWRAIGLSGVKQCLWLENWMK
jgi:hypothetical protein